MYFRGDFVTAQTITSSIWRRIRRGIVGLGGVELSTHTLFERRMASWLQKNGWL
jgi:hypothetical protein